MGRTCGEPDEIKKNTHPKFFTALFRERTRRSNGLCRGGVPQERLDPAQIERLGVAAACDQWPLPHLVQIEHERGAGVFAKVDEPIKRARVEQVSVGRARNRWPRKPL